MPDILDGQVDRLLRQAEERFQSDSFLLPTESVRQAPVINKSIDPAPVYASKREKLSIRQPQAQPHPAKVGQKDAGPQWYNLPKTSLTPEFKREWQLLRMRGLLDPKHQKKSLRVAAPEYSQVGEVIAGPTDFYSSRLTKRDRKATLSDEMMGAVDERKLQTKYAGIQRTKASGKKAFYQRLVSERRRKKT